MLPALSRWLIGAGMVLILAGVVVWALGLVPGLDRLPGDIYLRRGNFTFYFPLGTCILLSIVLSLVLMLFRR